MLEIELKYRVADFGPAMTQLGQWHAAAQATIDEADHYFNAPDRDFAQTDEAFRLRVIGNENRITYKGPKQGGLAKTRTEIEIALATGDSTADAFRRLVQMLGYRPTAVVKKRRTIFRMTRNGFAVEVCFDEVDLIGRFIEVEIVAEAAQRGEAERVLMDIAEQLNLRELERRSYLQMVLEFEEAKL